MKKQLAGLFVLAGLALSLYPLAHPEAKGHFTTVVLGAHGGLTDGDLSAYLVARTGTTDYACLDAGTVLKGITEGARKGSFKDVKVPKDSGMTLEGFVLQDRIKAYLLSHAHLDHVQGLVIDSTDDVRKDIMALDSTVVNLRDNMFNWVLWPNFGDEGDRPLNKYHYERLTPGQEYPIPGTELFARAFPLSHSGHPSTAFLVRCQESYLLYCGDTGPDPVEKSHQLGQVWATVAPLIQQKKLRAIFLEVSFPNGKPDNELFGHLTPDWMLRELRGLAGLVNPDKPKTALKGLNIVVSHIKPSLKQGDDVERQILTQLQKGNDLGLKFTIPHQGDKLQF